MVEALIRIELESLVTELEPLLRQIIREEVNNALLEKPAPMLPAEKHKELLTQKDVAEWLNISSVTIHRLRKDGRLAYFRVGNKILFSRDEHVMPFLRETGSGIGTRSRRRR